MQRVPTLGLVAALLAALGIAACGGGNKPPLQPDNDTLDDGGAPAAPSAAPAPAPPH
jgi:hypothetical protein